MGLKRKPPAKNVRRVASIDGNLRGVFTNKAGNIVQFESFHEYVKELVLDRDRSVVDYCSQPITLSFDDQNGKAHTYTPDFMVWRQDGTTEIHEVTLTARQKEPRIHQREEAASDICKKNNWRYVVDTEKTLPQETEVANLLGLLRYRPLVYANKAVTHAVFTLLHEQTPLSLQTLRTSIASSLALPESVVFTALCHLIWHDILSTDFQTLFVIDGTILSKISIWLTQQKGD